MKRLGISKIDDAVLRAQAKVLDALSGRSDGAIDSQEVDAALASATTVKDVREHKSVVHALRRMKTLLDAQGATAPAPPSAAGVSSLGVRLLALAAPAGEKLDARVATDVEGASGDWPAFPGRFVLDKGERAFAPGQRMIVPLESAELHVIEVAFKDRRPFKEQCFSFREPGGDWQDFYGDAFFALRKREAAGEIEIQRDAQRGAPVVQNPIYLDVTLVRPDGRKQRIGDKRIELHVDKMESGDQRGQLELDVFNRATEWLPAGKLPPGCALELSVWHKNPDLFKDSTAASAEIEFVRPLYLPDHAERVAAAEHDDFQPLAAGGYSVEIDRPIAAILVTWADGKTDAEGQLTMETDAGAFQSDHRWVSSGETEIIELDGRRSADGRVFLGGKKADAIRVKKVEVLYSTSS